MTQIIYIRNKRRNITIYPADINRIIRKYYEQLFANDSFKLEELDKFDKRHNIAKTDSRKIQILLYLY